MKYKKRVSMILIIALLLLMITDNFSSVRAADREFVENDFSSINGFQVQFNKNGALVDDIDLFYESGNPASKENQIVNLKVDFTLNNMVNFSGGEFFYVILPDSLDVHTLPLLIEKEVLPETNPKTYLTLANISKEDNKRIKITLHPNVATQTDISGGFSFNAHTASSIVNGNNDIEIKVFNTIKSNLKLTMSETKEDIRHIFTKFKPYLKFYHDELKK